MTKDIIERLRDSDQYVDALDDAVKEIQELRELLRECLPYVEDMIGIASSARSLLRDIEQHILKI